MPADEEGPWLLLIEGIAVVLLVYIEKSRALGVYIMGYILSRRQGGSTRAVGLTPLVGYILCGFYYGFYIMRTTRGVTVYLDIAVLEPPRPDPNPDPTPELPLLLDESIVEGMLLL